MNSPWVPGKRRSAVSLGSRTKTMVHSDLQADAQPLAGHELLHCL